MHFDLQACVPVSRCQASPFLGQPSSFRLRRVTCVLSHPVHESPRWHAEPEHRATSRPAKLRATMNAARTVLLRNYRVEHTIASSWSTNTSAPPKARKIRLMAVRQRHQQLQIAPINEEEPRCL